MHVKQAVRKAREYVGDLFADENIMDLRLEEVVHVEFPGEWKITISFSRPSSTAGEALATALAGSTRTAKIVEIDHSGRVVAVMNRA